MKIILSLLMCSPNKIIKLGKKQQMSEKGMRDHQPLLGEQAGHHAAERETKLGKNTNISVLQVVPGCSWRKCELYVNEELVCRNSSCIASGYRHLNLSVHLQFIVCELLLWNKWSSRPRFSCLIIVGN